MQEGKQGFIGVWIPKDVLNSTELTPAEKIIYANIASFDKCCFEPNRRLAEKCGVDERTIKRALKKLSELHFIAIEFVNNNSSKRRLYAIMDNPKKIAYLVKKGLFPQDNGADNREEGQSFPQGGQNVLGQNVPGQNVPVGGQNVLPQNRGEGGQNVTQRINKKKEEKETPEQKLNLEQPAAHAPFGGRMAASATNKKPTRKDYPDDKSFEDAYYAWNTTRCLTTS